HKEAIEKENIKRELSVAAEIQDRIIPKTLPIIEGYELAGTNLSSKEVGGDYYDCKHLNDGRIALIIADVAGKGVPASLLVSTLNATLNAYLEMDIPLPDLAKKINTVVYKSSPSDKFITFFIALLTPKTGELDMVNAGHNPILIRKKNGELDKVEAGGVAFGMFDMGLPFEGQKRIFEKGERILLYTDGIPEAMNENEEEYSDERLEKFMTDRFSESAEEFMSALISDVKSFTKETPQSDDITALFIERK
ncbi:MAG: serine/threonine-protein phosphatase, partial [Melioribacteraceae bacterium]|nr:serine/threonine-protein phosphatase [Melioribacteraceae bacterium]